MQQNDVCTSESYPTIPVLLRASSDAERILAYVKAKGSINNTECRTLLAVDLQRASYLLKKMHAEGALEKHGDRRWAHYRLPPLPS